jgi:hypothetical protein
MMNKDIIPDNGFLRVTLTGEFSLIEALDLNPRMMEALAQHALKKVLVDCLHLQGTITIMDRFTYAESLARELFRASKAGVSRGTLFAYVGKEPIIDVGRFGETVAVNRGVIVKVFDDNFEEALQFLKIDTSNQNKNEK